MLKTRHKSEAKTVDGITFHTNKEFIDKKIIKPVSFGIGGKRTCYLEKVSAFIIRDFEELFSKSHFSIAAVFGDYALKTYRENDANQLFIICKKTTC